MILRDATIKYKGYNPLDLKPKSNKRICCSCDECGRIRYVKKVNYKNLCRFCSHKGKNNPNYKPKITLTCKQCGNEYGVQPYNIKSAFCSNKCKNKYQSINFVNTNASNWKGGKIIKICKHCGKKYKIEKSKSYKSKFCSQKCYGKWESINGCGKDAPNWKGGIADIRDHVLPERDCIKLNSRFKGSEGHHIISGVIVYIPRNIHKSIWHSMKNGLRMNEINELAINYLIGGDI